MIYSSLHVFVNIHAIRRKGGYFIYCAAQESIITLFFIKKVNPRNNLLFACHLTNFCAQSTQGTRYLMNKYGDKKIPAVEEAK